MVSLAVYRRKLHRKTKRKRYARCSACGGFATMKIRYGEEVRGERVRAFKKCRDCRLKVEVFWSGGGMADA